MSPKNASTGLLQTLFAASILFSSAAYAEGQDEAFGIDEITCWDFTGLDETDRVAAASMVFGYVVAKQDMPVHSGASIKSAIEYAGKLCDANPDMYVASAIERGLQN